MRQRPPKGGLFSIRSEDRFERARGFRDRSAAQLSRGELLPTRKKDTMTFAYRPQSPAGTCLIRAYSKSAEHAVPHVKYAPVSKRSQTAATAGSDI